MYIFEGTNADSVWRAAGTKIRSRRHSDFQEGRGGPTGELLHVAFQIENQRQRWVMSRRPAANPAFAVAELIWTLRGRDDAGFLNYWNPRLPRFAGSGERYPGAYGFRLRKSLGMDQLERSYHALLREPSGRQVVLQIWDARVDMPGSDGKPASSDVPCNICAMLKIRSNRLEWTQIARSNDLFLGIPYDFFLFTALQEIVAGWLGIEPGRYVHMSDSLHVYVRDMRSLERMGRSSNAPNTDVLALRKQESDRVFAELERRAELLMQKNLSKQELLGTSESRLLPSPYQNLLRVLAADAARRRGWFEDARRIAIACDNPMLRLATRQWLQRRARKERPTLPGVPHARLLRAAQPDAAL